MSARPNYWAFAGLLLLALACYGNSLPGAFILDDNTIIVDNPLVARPDLWRIFTTDYWGLDANSGLFRPLTILSFALNRLFLGAGPAGFHVINILLHGAATLLFAAALLRHRVPARLAWTAVVLFAVHPLHTEAVNLVVGRAELLCALFVFAALWFSAAPRPAVACAGSGTAFLLALLSKENGVVLLGLLPLLDIACGRWRAGGWRQRLGIYAVLALVLLAWLGWRHWGVEHRVPPVAFETPFAPLAAMETWTRVLTALKIQWFYLWKLLWPVDLQAVYAGERWFAIVEPFSSAGVAVVLGTGLLAAGCCYGCCRGAWAAWAMVLYAVAFAPTSNLILPIGVSMAERLAYLPSAWFCLAVAAVLWKLPRRTAVAAITGLLVLGLTMATWVRNRDYASAITLWEKAVQRDPLNPIAWLYLGEAHFDAGDLAAADAAFRHQAEIAPDFNRQTSGYGDYLFLRGEFDRAIKAGLRDEERGVTSPENRMALARSYLALGNPTEAWRWLESCRNHYGDYALYWRVRGEILAAQGDLDGAIVAWTQAMNLATHDDLPLEVVKLLVARGRFSEAESVAKKLLERVRSADTWNALGITLAEQKRFAEAVSAFEQALALDPDDTLLRSNAARARRSAETQPGGSR